MKLSFEKAEFIDNPKYIKSQIIIETVSGEGVIRWNFTLLKTLDVKVTVSKPISINNNNCFFFRICFKLKLDVFRLPQLKTPILPVPKMNYCDMIKNYIPIPIVTDGNAMIP
jgi:hypothetical protein